MTLLGKNTVIRRRLEHIIAAVRNSNRVTDFDMTE